MLAERLAPMPPDVLQYLIADGALNGTPATPTAHPIDERERSVVATAFASLPPQIRALAERHVGAIYIVDDLGSSAWTEYFDPPGRQSFMVFDASVLRETANAWATRKERSAFADGTDVRLELAATENDDPGGAFRFIFLHELGHAVSYGQRLLPTWVDNVGSEFPYARLVADVKRTVPNVPYYATADRRLPATQAKSLYALWNASNHPTLYASVGLEEDFAECFASFVHVEMLRQPYRLSLAGDHYDNGISQPRCAPKRAFIAGLIAP